MDPRRGSVGGVGRLGGGEIDGVGNCLPAAATRLVQGVDGGGADRGRQLLQGGPGLGQVVLGQGLPRRQVGFVGVG